MHVVGHGSFWRRNIGPAQEHWAGAGSSGWVQGPTLAGMTPGDLAAQLRRLHDAPEPLILVNVWDVASARIVAGLPGCTALATASHSIAAAHGFDDGEQIPLDLMIDAIARIAAAVELPVSADLE